MIATYFSTSRLSSDDKNDNFAIFYFQVNYMSNRSSFLLYGANGFTSKLIIELAAPYGLQPILAGRNEAKIKQLAQQHGLPYRIADLNNGGALDNMLREITVVLNCAGPFSQTALPMQQACLRNAVHYLDITGEIAVFEKSATLHGQQTAYSASKFAVRGFTNALRHELENTSVKVMVVHPGGVATSIAKSALIPEGTTEMQTEERLSRSEKYLRMPPAKAGEIIVSGIIKGKARVLVGTDAKILSLLERILPVGYWNILKKFAKSEDS